eukprot:jgi/Hompol1/5880/HPOL_000179-RA
MSSSSDYAEVSVAETTTNSKTSVRRTINRRQRATNDTSTASKGTTHIDQCSTQSFLPSADIVGSCLESRFHADTLETLARDLDLRQLTVEFSNGNVLIAGAHLLLREGVHYGLVGRNGTGKSTLLKAIADGLIAGFPSNIKPLLVEQIADHAAQHRTVLEEVLCSDRHMCDLLHDLLQNALDSLKLKQVVNALHSLRIKELERTLASAISQSKSRTGKRGWQARQDVLKAEQNLAAAQADVSLVVPKADAHTHL